MASAACRNLIRSFLRSPVEGSTGAATFPALVSFVSSVRSSSTSSGNTLSQSSSLRPGNSTASPYLCGRGDKKTKKGKRFRGRFGNARPNREHRIRRIRERWEQPPGTPWPVPGLSIEDYRPVF